MKKSLSEIREELKFLKDYWVVIYGSWNTDYFIPERSDIDIAVITQKHDKKENIKIWESILGKFPSIYDVKIFELMPLYLKIEVIESHEVLFGDPLEISEYFYFYRKLWRDMEYRYKENQFKDIKEKMMLMENQKKI
ncbi:MAG: nucleotidyltransferase domain-containing protein [Promethearchaeota archaeon]